MVPKKLSGTPKKQTENTDLQILLIIAEFIDFGPMTDVRSDKQLWNTIYHII